MTSDLRSIPEVAALDATLGMLRIPPELDVPLTDRVRRLIDTAEFRRLARIPQLGLVSLIYPGATHSRFEHSLGVYRLALLFLRQLSRDERFRGAVDPDAARLLITAALLHDVGHWPFCHPIEDLRLPGVPDHETFVARHLQGELGERLIDDWGVAPHDVVQLLSEPPRDRRMKLLSSLLSGPIDIDKLDYLNRDSLHAGVPYGRHFDQGRLISSLCLNSAGDGLAITEKGKTAAELMVFARYVMFSEVYWHHGVRVATSMLQRAFYDLFRHLELEKLFVLTEGPMVAELIRAAGPGPAGRLLQDLLGSRRRLYKRVAQYSFFEQSDLYRMLARRPYCWLVSCCEELAQQVSGALGTVISSHELLIDAPPVQKEVELDIEIYFLKETRYRRLEEVSPVVRTLAREQFDDYVKRVRLFAHPRIAPALRGLATLPDLVARAADATGTEPWNE